MALLDDVKVTCRVTSTAFDVELLDLVAAAFADLGITDISPELLHDTELEPLIKRAVLTYCKMNFGVLEDQVYARLKASYDEQKSQLLMSSAYNSRGGDANV